MWRDGSGIKVETKFMDEVLHEVEVDKEIETKVEKRLKDLEKRYPILADAFDSPQSADKHAEGPRVRDHIKLILTNLNGLLDGKFSLNEIEELARLKGYEGEFEEMEEVIKERASFFQAFALVHDIGKGAATRLIAQEGTPGFELGFDYKSSASWGDFGGEDRLVARKKYDDLFAGFQAEHSKLDPQELQLEFFNKYQISVSNWGHAQAAYAPHFQKVIIKVAKELRLSDSDVDLLIDLINLHMHPLHYFRQGADPKFYQSLVELVTARGYDSDDFLDILEAGTLLDKVFGIKCQKAGQYFHNPLIITNFLKSEHDWAPYKREKAKLIREAEIEKYRKKIIREVGLDGEAIMQLTGMSPGPELGKLLRNLRDCVEQDQDLPKFKKAVAKELKVRVQNAKLKFDQMI